MRPSLLFGLLTMALFASTSAQAEELRVEGVLTHTAQVRDMLGTPSSIFVATSGGVDEFDRATTKRIKTYTTQDGLPSLAVSQLFRASQGRQKGSLVARVEGEDCYLRGNTFRCEPNGRLEKSQSQRKSRSPALRGTLSLDYRKGQRITVQKQYRGAELLGTAKSGAFLDGKRLGDQQALQDSHVTSLAIFNDSLWIGTFNGGLSRQDAKGSFSSAKSPSTMINALCAGPHHLFVGSSDGLFKTTDGVVFERVEFVEGAVVGLAFDGNSLWATTPGALYRVKDGKGPPTDVWWMPGGSRSLQKVSAVPGWLWIGTEDRGAVRMKTSPSVVSKDRPFTVFDRSHGLASSWSLATLALRDGGAIMSTLREGVSLISTTGESRPLSIPISPWGLGGLAEDKGVWVGSQGGAAWLPRVNAPAQAISELPDERVHVFFRDTRPAFKGRLWIGTENGLAWL